MPTETVPRWRSLRAKLALFLLLFSIPALIMVEFAVLSFEYFEVISRFNRGALQHQAQLLARELYPHLDQPPEELRLRLNNARLQLQDPRSTWLGEPFVLSELSDQPIRITLRRADGSLWIAALVAPAIPEPGARIFEHVKKAVKANGAATIGGEIKTVHVKFSCEQFVSVESPHVRRFLVG